MFAINWRSWPLVTMTARDALTPSDADMYLAGLDFCLARREPFAVVLDFQAVAGAEADRGAGIDLHAKWLNRVRGEIRRYCRGVAYVLPTREQVDGARAVVEQEGDRLWSCPVAVAPRLDDSIAWARHRLTECTEPACPIEHLCRAAVADPRAATLATSGPQPAGVDPLPFRMRRELATSGHREGRHA